MLPLIIMAIEDEDDKAFMAWLYLQYRRLIYSEVRKIVGNTDDVEDLYRLARAWLDLDKKRSTCLAQSTLKEKRQRDCRRPEYASG